MTEVIWDSKLPFIDKPKKSIHNIWCQLGTRDLLDDGDGLFKVHTGAIWAVGVHSVKAVRHSDDLRHAGDFLIYSLRGAVHLFSIKKQAGFPTCLLLTAMFNRSAALSGTHLCAKYQHGALSNIMKCHDCVNFTEGEQVMVIRKLPRKKYAKLFDKL